MESVLFRPKHVSWKHVSWTTSRWHGFRGYTFCRPCGVPRKRVFGHMLLWRLVDNLFLCCCFFNKIWNEHSGAVLNQMSKQDMCQWDERRKAPPSIVFESQPRIGFACFHRQLPVNLHCILSHRVRSSRFADGVESPVRMRRKCFDETLHVDERTCRWSVVLQTDRRNAMLLKSHYTGDEKISERVDEHTLQTKTT